MVGRALKWRFDRFQYDFLPISECHFAWQAQYLVRLEGECCCSAHCKWYFMWPRSIMHVILRGRRNIWWGWRVSAVPPRMVNDVSNVSRSRRNIWWSWRMTLVVPRIVNAVSYVRRINDEIHFAWQVQYLVSWKGDFTGSAHCKWHFICEADRSWDSFCVAGAIFGAPRIVNDVSYVRRINHEIHFAWQAQYFVRWRLPFVASRMVNDVSYLCEQDQSRDSFFMAGAIFDEVGGWRLLFRAL